MSILGHKSPLLIELMNPATRAGGGPVRQITRRLSKSSGLNFQGTAQIERANFDAATGHCQVGNARADPDIAPRNSRPWSGHPYGSRDPQTPFPPAGPEQDLAFTVRTAHCANETLRHRVPVRARGGR